jgi:hypothetical protein
MQFSLTTLKARKLAIIIMFLIISVVALIWAHYEPAEQKEIREWAGAPKPTPWPVYVALALGAGVVYIMVAKIAERRLRYIGACLPAAALLSIYLLDDFWWNWIVGYAVMLAIVLIGWLYPARNASGDQT